MDKEITDPSPDQDVVESDDDKDVEPKLEVNRSAEEYASRLVEVSAENKTFRGANVRLKKRVQELEDKTRVDEQGKLQEQGKWKELAETRGKDLDEAKKKNVDLTQTIAWKAVNSAVREEAAAQKCIDIDALVRLAPSAEELGVDQNFDVSKEAVTDMVAKMRKKHHYLFDQRKIPIKDGPIADIDLTDSTAYDAALRSCKTQAQFDDIRKKYKKDIFIR